MGWAECGNCCVGSPARAERAVLGVMRPFHSVDGHCGVHGGTGDHPECQIRLRLGAWVTQGHLGSRAEVNGVTNQMPWLTIQGSDSEVCPRDPSVSLKGRLQGPVADGQAVAFQAWVCPGLSFHQDSDCTEVWTPQTQCQAGWYPDPRVLNSGSRLVTRLMCDLMCDMSQWDPLLRP